MKTITYDEAIKFLGPETEAALDCMWESKDFEDEVELGTFLRSWTEYVDASARFAERSGL